MKHKLNKLKHVFVCSCGRVFVERKDAAEHLSIQQKEVSDGNKAADGEGDGVPEENPGAEA